MKVRKYSIICHKLMDGHIFQFFLLHIFTILLWQSIGHKRPTLCDVYKFVVPECAHNWRYLGTLLHFKQAELGIIFSNFRNDAEECCRSLLSRWLEKNPDASWDQLFSAVDDLPELAYQGINQIR